MSCKDNSLHQITNNIWNSYFFKKPGIHLLSHAVTSIVPSAAYVLTIVFGMGTGVSHKRITTGKVFELSSFEMLPICAFASQKLNRRRSPYARFL